MTVPDDSCPNDNVPSIGYIGDGYVFKYIPLYLGPATDRLNAFAGGNKLTVNDTYAMQSICAYEYNALGGSPFCGLFTEGEWEGFEYTLDLEYYYDYSELRVVLSLWEHRETERNETGFGQPTGRAQGIGYVQELAARLDGRYITTSDSSVNSTLDGNPTTFPLGQPFYVRLFQDFFFGLLWLINYSIFFFGGG